MTVPSRRPGSASTDPDNHVAFRLEIARRINQCYEPGCPVALTAAGSVGAGLADRWSDLELDCYWCEPPTEAQRKAPIDRIGGEHAVLWDYDETDAEWSDDYVLEGLEVTISNFTVSTVEAFIGAVVEDAGTDPITHFRLAAIRRCVPLRGETLVRDWQEQARTYPDRLVAAMVERALAPDALLGWSSRDALVQRRDLVALHGLLSRIEQAVISSLLALNRTYEAHPLLKWERHLLGGLQLAPRQLSARLQQMWSEDHAQALVAAENLLGDTLVLAEQHSKAQLSQFREAFAARRKPVSVDDLHTLRSTAHTRPT